MQNKQWQHILEINRLLEEWKKILSVNAFLELVERIPSRTIRRTYLTKR